MNVAITDKQGHITTYNQEDSEMWSRATDICMVTVCNRGHTRAFSGGGGGCSL